MDRLSAARAPAGAVRARAALLLGLVALAAATLTLLWPARALGPEAAIRALVAGAVAGAEARDAARVVAPVAEDFRGQGGATRQDLQQLVLGHLLGSREPPVVLNPTLEVVLHSPTAATFSGTFLFLRGRTEQAGSRYRVEAGLERRGGVWTIVSARWEAF